MIVGDQIYIGSLHESTDGIGLRALLSFSSA